jgi:hypothetical protein
MMERINHGWLMGFGWGWIIGLATQVVIIWLVRFPLILTTTFRSKLTTRSFLESM